MFSHFSSTSKGQLLVLFLILVLLSGCGQSSSSQTTQKTLISSYSGKITPTSIPDPSPLGTSVSFDLGGWLHIQSALGFTCRFTSNGRPFTPGTLVLPTVQPTYDQGTLQSVENYIMRAYQVNHSRIDTIPYPPFSVNPNTFQLAPVSSATRGDCGETLQVTNIGNAPVQISQVSIQFATDTHVSTQHYNLVDLCSLNSSLCFIAGGGQGGYTANFDLDSSGKANTIMPAITWGSATRDSSSNQVPSLKPGEVIKIYLAYLGKSSNLSFSFVPMFTLDWPGTGKQAIYPASQLQSAFTFASASQFSCYTLQGQQFTEVSLADTHHYCM